MLDWTISVSPFVSATVLSCLELACTRLKSIMERILMANNHLSSIAKSSIQQRPHDVSCFCGEIFGSSAQAGGERYDC